MKTLILEDDAGEPLIVLMHGDREVSLKALARQAGRRSVQMCRPEVAHRHSGYLVGGTSPFGTRKRMLDLRITHTRCPSCGKLYRRGGACPCSRR